MSQDKNYFHELSKVTNSVNGLIGGLNSLISQVPKDQQHLVDKAMQEANLSGALKDFESKKADLDKMFKNIVNNGF